MTDWQERVVQEKKELDEKIDRLCTFLNSHFGKEVRGREFLVRQHWAMNLYSACLADRIDQFEN